MTVAALLMIQAAVTDKGSYRQYQAAVQPLIESCGGRLRATGVGLEVLEGGAPSRRLVVFEFPSMAALRAFWHSAEYAGVRRLREGAAEVDVWALQAS